MLARAVCRVRRLAVPVVALANVLLACQPSPQSRPSVTRSTPAAAHAGRHSTAAPPAFEQPPARTTPSGAAQALPEELERLRARYGSAPALLRFRGEVSYYSDALAGRPTASGEPYQPGVLSAAHRSLPFGTLVRVVREDTGQVVYVRINDRGPFVRGRVLDLSRAAAGALGILGRGVAPVTGEVLEYGPKPKKKHKKKRRKR